MNRERKWDQHETDCKTMGIDSISGSQFCYIYDGIPYIGNVWVKSEEIHVKSTETEKNKERRLDYLKAGGRVSNTNALIGNLLHIHPCIRIEEGKLMASEKYRGSMEKIAPKLIRSHMEKYSLKKEKLYLLCSPGLSAEAKDAAYREACGCGFKKIIWIRTGGVITSHAGPGCFGVVGIEE